MNRIAIRFEQLAKRREKAFIPFIVAGDPDLDCAAKIVIELEHAGADVIELGVPFSDPIADGIVIQEAAQRALEKGASLHAVIDSVGRMRQHTQTPLLLFTYYNPVMAYGIEAFAADAARAGVDGVLCVDLPPEEAGEYKTRLDAHELATVFLVAPTSPDERIALIAEQSTGFIYYVSRTGVTGVRQDVEETTRAMVAKIRKHSDKPVAVGFGVSTPDQAREIAAYADGVIVGSAIVSLIGKLGGSADMPRRVGTFAKSLADAVKGL